MSTRRLSNATAVALLFVSVEANAAPPTPVVSAQVVAPAPDEPMAEFRERFKEGMDRYRAGALTEAIGYWDPIYRQLGEQKGYRLAYNLGVAYAEQGDATRAAERLQTFLGQVDARRSRGETLEAIVQKEEADARSRMAVLAALKGRLQVDAGSPPHAVQIDASEPRLAGFVAWVNPGEHTVTYAPGTPDTQTIHVTVRAGETAEVPPPPPSAAPPPPSATTGSPSSPAGPPNVATTAPTQASSERPFSPALLAVTGGLAIVATIVAVKFDDDALAKYHSLSAQYPNGLPADASGRRTLDDQRTLAYSTIGAAAGLGALTAGLVAWYFLGGSRSNHEIGFTPAGISGRF